jgi:hypothetical protein
MWGIQLFVGPGEILLTIVGGRGGLGESGRRSTLQETDDGVD